MDSIPQSILITVPLWEGQTQPKFSVNFTDALIRMPSKIADRGVRFVTVCVLRPVDNEFDGSPWSGVAILHPEDIHIQEIGCKLAFKRAVKAFTDERSFMDNRLVWDLFRRALWAARNPSMPYSLPKEKTKI